MKVSYYPGCTLKNKARELDLYARRSAEALGFELCEIDDWQCCGGAFTSSSDEIVTKLAAIRALKAAADAGTPLVTVCAACHNVLKRSNLSMKDPAFAAKVNTYMAQDANYTHPYNGEAQVVHYLEFLRDRVSFDKLRECVKNPLTGRRIAAYYGCLLLRPGKEMSFDDPENPTIMESFIRALGAEPVIYPARNECCGGYLAVEDANAAKKHSLAVSRSAENHGAELLVTACPLCRYNLQKSGSELPVVYFTDLLAEALGVKED